MLVYIHIRSVIYLNGNHHSNKLSDKQAPNLKDSSVNKHTLHHPLRTTKLSLITKLQ